MPIFHLNSKPSDTVNVVHLDSGAESPRQVSAIYHLLADTAVLVWQYIRGYIFTKDGFSLSTKDGFVVKCKDQ